MEETNSPLSSDLLLHPHPLCSLSKDMPEIKGAQGCSGLNGETEAGWDTFPLPQCPDCQAAQLTWLQGYKREPGKLGKK